MPTQNNAKRLSILQTFDRGIRLRAKIRLDRFILSTSGGENSQFLPFFGLRHLVMSTVGRNLRKLNTDTQLQAFSYFQWHQNRFCTPTASCRNRAHKLRRSQV